MRKFFLENSAGERLSLSQPGALWLNRPEGLGMSMANTYEAFTAGFFEVTEEEEANLRISGTLVFLKPDVYAQFREVTDWIMRANGLKLIYKPYGEREYYRDIRIDSIGKSEKKLSRMLEAPIVFAPLSPWYDQFSHVFEFSIEDSEDYKEYNYYYDYLYPSAFQPGTVDLTVSGHYPATVEVQAEGPFSSPVLSVSDADTGKVYGKLDLSNVTVSENETLFYSSKNGEPGVWLMSSNAKTDIIDQVELNADSQSFFSIPPNIPVVATMTVVGELSAKVTMRVHQYYRLR